MKKPLKNLALLLLVASQITGTGAAFAQSPTKPDPLVVEEQGSFAVGGTVVTTPGTYNNNAPTAEGQSLHGDHLYRLLPGPAEPERCLSSCCTVPINRAGVGKRRLTGERAFRTFSSVAAFRSIWLTSRAAGVPAIVPSLRAIEPTPYDQLFFDQFRIGIWPEYFENVQFDRDPKALEQFFRSVTPNTGPYDPGVISSAMSALFDRIGDGILFTHSQAGGPGLACRDQEP